MKWLSCGRCACFSAANNPASMRLIGLCPMLATTTSVIKALAMALMLIAVMVIANGAASLCRATVVWRLKPIYFALLASFATMLVVNLATVAMPALVDSLSIYPLLFAANCLVLSSAQEFAEHQPPIPALRRAGADGGGVLLMMLIIAVIRELGAHGRLAHDRGLLGGNPVVAHEQFQGLIPLLGKPPGALLILALTLAAANALRSRYPGLLGAAAAHSA